MQRDELWTIAPGVRFLENLAGFPLWLTIRSAEESFGVDLTGTRLTSLRLSRRRSAVTSTALRPPKMPTSSRRGLIAPNRATRGASGGVKEEEL